MPVANPIIDTHFDEALSRGMGMGLHAAQLRQMQLYRHDAMALKQEQLQNQLNRTGLYAQNLENHNSFLRDRLAEQERHNQAGEDAKTGDPDANTFVTGFMDGSNVAPPATLDLYPQTEQGPMGPPSQGDNPDYADFQGQLTNGIAMARPQLAAAAIHKLMSDHSADAMHDKWQRIASDPNLSDDQKKAAMYADVVGNSHVAGSVANRVLGPTQQQIQQQQDRQDNMARQQGNADRGFDQRERIHADEMNKPHGKQYSDVDSLGAYAQDAEKTYRAAAQKAGNFTHAMEMKYGVNLDQMSPDERAIYTRYVANEDNLLGTWTAAMGQHRAAIQAKIPQPPPAAPQQQAPAMPPMSQQAPPPAPVQQRPAQIPATPPPRPMAPPPAIAGAPTAPAMGQGFNTDLIDRLHAQNPAASDEDIADQYRKLTSGAPQP